MNVWLGIILPLAFCALLVWASYCANKTSETDGHNTLDYSCKYWWGDRAGSLQARCYLCDPPKFKETK